MCDTGDSRGSQEASAFRIAYHKPGPDGIFLAEAQSDKGELLAMGAGDDSQDALLELAPDLLPPEDDSTN